jgi:hypothetical protein
MAVDDYSTTPGSNGTISGINIAENCPPGNINNAIRQIMADVKSFKDGLTDTSTLMPKAGGIFSGTQPIYTGRGAYLHHNASANASGRVYLLADGASLPTSPSNGDLVFFYTP